MNKWPISILILITDTFALFAAWYLAREVGPTLFTSWYGQHYFVVATANAYAATPLFGILSGLAIFLFLNKNHYSVRTPWWNQVRDVGLITVVCLLIHGFVQKQAPHFIVFSFWMTSFVLILFGRQLSRFIGLVIGQWKIPTIIIGDGENAVDTFYAIHSDHYPGYDVKQLILRCRHFDEFDLEELPPEFHDVPIKDGRQDIARALEIQPDTFYIIALDTFRGEEREIILQRLHDLQADYVIVPPIKRSSLYGMEPYYFFGSDTMFLRSRNKIDAPGARIIKRLFDIVGALFGLLLTAPVFFVVALLAIKARRNIFFGHPRVGKHNKIFMCWKFQTMVPDAKERLKKILENDPEAKAEWETTHKLKDDPRVHTIGKFLRKTSLDELPQLFNVLKGEMSLAGPRPIVKDEKKFYGEHIDYYLSVRPGITGLWQASGRSNTTYAHRVYLDGWYVRNWSLSQDLVILFKTISALMFRRGAY